ncbi:MAG: Hpt domain-containing protein, partial [Arenicella sp.]|nr:Hpt domain-containing protein [Arenicella sp.]
MSIYSNIDIETFKWVKGEVELTLDSASTELQNFVSTDDTESLYGLSNHLHQVVGSLQMLEMRALSSLMMECELLIEDFTSTDRKIGKSSFVVLLDSAFLALKATFARIENGLPENPTDVVELVNQIRSSRGLKGIEISSLFSPMIEIFPEVNSRKILKDKAYVERAKALRVYYQTFLLQWLRDGDDTAIDKLAMVIDKLFQMSSFGVVARLWWVASAYVDYVKHNDLGNKLVHSRIFRQIDDRFRELELHGESALVRDPADELIKIMLFYTGVGEKRTERMDEIVDAFKLQEYFPALKIEEDAVDFNQLEANLEQLKGDDDLPLTLIRQLVTSYFETEQHDSSGLVDMLTQLEILEKATEKQDAGIVYEISAQASEVVRGLRRGLVQRDEDTGFHLASALMFVENSIHNPDDVDSNWLQNGQLKRQALIALNNQEELTDSMDGVHLSGSERQALLDVVGSEIEENLKDIEAKLEEFGADSSKTEILNGIDGKIRQIRGALQVLGEQKVGLLLKMAEEQFVALESGEVEASAELNEALAITIGTMEEYVKGLQNNRTGMDYLLDRSITDLEVAIGKTVSRDDVEDLLDVASDSLFSWLTNQSDLALFTNLKSSLRDLTILAKKTNLSQVEHLVKEQDRLVDVISQEPAFLTDNITSNLQNNMAAITEQIITLYGTEETAEELQQDADLAYKRSAIESDQDETSVRFHDDMDIAELGDDVVEEIQEAELATENISSTEIARLHAVNQTEALVVDEAIFEVFLEESVEVLEEANIQYKICKDDSNDRNAIRELRRAFHTLKGSARMVGLNDVAEVAWLSESLFNYVLDTEKPLSSGTLRFARDSLDEFQTQLDDRYANQHLIDTAEWGRKTERIGSGEDDVDQESVDGAPELDVSEPIAAHDTPEAPLEDEEIPVEEAPVEEGLEVVEASDEFEIIEEADLEEDADEIEIIEEIEIASSHDIDELHDIEVSDASETESVELDFGDFELEEIEPEHAGEPIIDLYEPASDDELADILEMNSESSIIEFANEMVLEEDSVLDLSNEELGDVLAANPLDAEAAEERINESIAEHSQVDEDHELDEQSSELEAKSVADSLVNDPETREIFVQEAHSKLDQIAEELDKDVISFGGDKMLSIAIHTLRGNSRTLGMTDVAAAYLSAENLCQAKSENGTSITEEEYTLLRSLLDQSRAGFENPLDKYPYYYWEISEFNKIQRGLDLAARAELDKQIQAKSIASSDEKILGIDVDDILVDLDEDTFADFEALSGDQTLGQDTISADAIEIDLDGDDIIELDLTDGGLSDLDLISGDDSPSKADSENESDRVAAVVEDLDPIDDLIHDADLDTDIEAESDDDLSGFESSLSAFKQAKAIDYDTIETDSVQGESLIPGDLTNLLTDELLSLEAESLMELSDLQE